jgi:hypothetical protein
VLHVLRPAHAAASSLQAYVGALAVHPALRGCEEVCLFLSHPDLSGCEKWRRLRQRPAPRGIRALLAGLAPGGAGACGGPIGGGDGPKRAPQPAAPPAAAGPAARPRPTATGRAQVQGPAPAGGGRAISGLAYAAMRAKAAPPAPPARSPLSGDELALRRAKGDLGKLLAHVAATAAAARSLVAHMEAAFGGPLGGAAACGGGDGGALGPGGLRRDPEASIAEQVASSLAFLHSWQARQGADRAAVQRGPASMSRWGSGCRRRYPSAAGARSSHLPHLLPCPAPCPTPCQPARCWSPRR